MHKKDADLFKNQIKGILTLASDPNPSARSLGQCSAGTRIQALRRSDHTRPYLLNNERGSFTCENKHQPRLNKRR